MGGLVSQCDASLGNLLWAVLLSRTACLTQRGHCVLLPYMLANPIHAKGTPAVLNARNFCLFATILGPKQYSESVLATVSVVVSNPSAAGISEQKINSWYLLLRGESLEVQRDFNVRHSFLSLHTNKINSTEEEEK
ncbi:hypothetical protein mRhiFer1_009957 [Rhinolophus ferrumequinum]|uniref:Uncharacterized protein n=1 Tax=Rhinolophus ferrumequinum TaxID=59479 RepID=A0A7J7YID6_RHIFE|nr:hypothetical protein mRhiFer1_009957 [Rhinolophus ferrumequinum]